MGLKKSELKKISEMDLEEMKGAIEDLDETSIAAIYDMEVAKSTPRNEIMELLLDASNNDGDQDDPVVEEVVEGAFNGNKEFDMCWHKGVKCYHQNGKLYDPVSKKEVK